MKGQIILIVCTLLIFLSLVCDGYIQKMTFHENEDETGNFFVFRNNVPDVNAHTSLRTCKRFCYHGGWHAYTNVNFGGTAWNGEYHTNTCFNTSMFIGGVFPHQSFRRFGDSDTSINALTMYNTLFGDNNFMITKPAAANLNFPTYGIIGQTGQGSWTFFEGTEFDGPRYCIPGTGKNGTYSFQVWREFDLTMIGSVVQGCFADTEADNEELRQILSLYGNQEKFL